MKIQQTRVFRSSLIRCLPTLLLICGILHNSVLAQDRNAATANAADNARALEIGRELAARQLAIENLQSDLGIYDLSLIEAYSDLGAFYIEIEDFESAIRLYKEALQIARINTGLFSEQQMPAINALIDNNGKLKDWEEVDDLQQLSYHINSRLYPVSDPRYVVAAEEFGSWKLRVLRENLLDQSYRGLTDTALDLSNFYQRVISNIEVHTDVKPEGLLSMVYGKSLADLTLARSVANTPYTAFEGGVNRYVNQTRCQNVRNAQGQVVRQCYSVQVENPRYRQSQRDAKQFALNRYTRAVVRSIEKLRTIKDQSTELTVGEKQQLEVQIAELQTESEQLLRASRRLYLR